MFFSHFFFSLLLIISLHIYIISKYKLLFQSFASQKNILSLSLEVLDFDYNLASVSRESWLSTEIWKVRVKCTKMCFINTPQRSTIGKTFAWQKKFKSHQLPDSPCQRQIWPVKSGAKLKPGCYSDMTLNFFSPSKHLGNNGYLRGIDKTHLGTFHQPFRSRFIK